MNVLGPRFDTLGESASKFSGSNGFELETRRHKFWNSTVCLKLFLVYFDIYISFKINK